MRSVDTVTSGRRQKRVAAMNDTSSIQASAVPPNRVLWWLVVDGNTALVTRVTDSSVRRSISCSLGVMGFISANKFQTTKKQPEGCFFRMVAAATGQAVLRTVFP
ncbi:hypothetical protein D3C80_1923140 [compost metagenome]